MGTHYTEDAKPFMEGDVLFNYYDMLPGRVGRIDPDGWFDFFQEGGITQLNGERVCSMELAEARGWVSKGAML